MNLKSAHADETATGRSLGDLVAQARQRILHVLTLLGLAAADSNESLRDQQ